MKALVAGWFSFRGGHATAGDVMAADVVTGWLDEIKIESDVAFVPPFDGNVDWREASPENYDLIIFVCGPFENKFYEAQFFQRFQNNYIVGINVTLNDAPEEWNPFDVLIERDSPVSGRPELAFLGNSPKVPVVGVCLVEDYPEGETKTANDAIERLLDHYDVAKVFIDTRLDVNEFRLKSKQEVESVISKIDVMVTTRLHGTVLAIKNSIPVLPIDPKWGGGKIVQQTKTISWPVCFSVDNLDTNELDRAFEYCLSPEARQVAADCNHQAINLLAGVRDEFQKSIQTRRINCDTKLQKKSRDRLFDLLPKPN